MKSSKLLILYFLSAVVVALITVLIWVISINTFFDNTFAILYTIGFFFIFVFLGLNLLNNIKIE